MIGRIRNSIAFAAVLTSASIACAAQASDIQKNTSTAESPITGVYFDVAHLHHDANSNGDTWDYAWASNDILYTFNCDGRGYGKFAGRNVSFNKLVGDRWDDLTGYSVNPMTYGKGEQQEPNQSNWKTTGSAAIDGALYAFIANNWYGSQNAYGGPEPDPHIRQTVMNMSLIRSTDEGKTWTRTAAENYAAPMWRSRKFSTAFFIKYGKDGGQTHQDDQDKYVYAISNDGYWNCGSQFYLGRVLRSEIGKLRASDWQFFADGKWVADVNEATALPGFANGQMKETMGSVLWLATLHQYVTVTWFDPGTTEKWHFPENVTFAFYSADHPWGPWHWIGEKSAGDFIADRNSRIHRWYGPSLSPRFITDNPDGSVTAILTFSGQTWEDTPTSLYKNNSLPVTFYTTPLPKVVKTWNDTDAKYVGDWSYETNTSRGDFRDDAHVTDAPNASAEFSFKGTGIELLSEKSSDMGNVEIVLDGKPEGTVSLYQNPMPLLYQLEVYRNMNLEPGDHTLRVINRSPSSKRIVIDGFRVYGGKDFDPSSLYLVRNRVTGDALVYHDGKLAALSAKPGETGIGWQIDHRDSGFYALSLNSPHRYLGTDKVDGSAALVDFPVSSDQKDDLWIISPVGNGTFWIVNRENGRALTETIGTASQRRVSQLEYMGRDVQKWEIVNLQEAF